MKTSLRRALWAGAVVAVAAAAVPMVTASAAGTVTAAFASAGDWGSGHQGAVTVTNGSDKAVTWKIEFTLPAGASINSSWDADVTKSGQNYTAVAKSWAGQLAPGAKLTWGYIGTGPFKAPTACKINGATCAGGGTPDPGPSNPNPGPSNPNPGPSNPDPGPSNPDPGPDPNPNPDTSKWVVGYFAQWGIYDRKYFPKNIDTSGSAKTVTHILYSFSNPLDGKCTLTGHAKADPFADYEKAFTAAESVDGVADSWDAPVRGNFGQLLKLKKKHPHLKVLLSVGGWTFSAGFTAAMKDLNGFVNSCYSVINDPRWKGLFDGIDIDWEFPQDCGGDVEHCDNSGYDAYKRMMQALRAKFPKPFLITSAITADGRQGGKIDKADYAGGAQYLDKLFVMTYDFFGGWTPNGPTAPHSPLYNYPGMPIQDMSSDKAIQKLKSKGIPTSKMLLGIPFYARGWTGVTQEAPGGNAGGKAAGTWEAGVADYKDIKNNKCAGASVKTIAGTAYALCSGGNWWSWDSVQTIGGKMQYVKDQKLGGVLFWEFNGDTTNGDLINAIRAGL